MLLVSFSLFLEIEHHSWGCVCYDVVGLLKMLNTNSQLIRLFLDDCAGNHDKTDNSALELRSLLWPYTSLKIVLLNVTLGRFYSRARSLS